MKWFSRWFLSGINFGKLDEIIWVLIKSPLSNETVWARMEIAGWRWYGQSNG